MAITINGTGTLTGVSVGGLPDGIVDTDMLAANAVTAAKRGAGAILQVVSGIATSQASQASSGTSFADTGLSASITPSSSSNKVLVMGYVSYSARTTAGQNGSMEWNFAVCDGSDNILDGTTAETDGYRNNEQYISGGKHPINFLHSPSTTSAFTYKIRMNARNSNNTMSLYCQYAGAHSSRIVLMEVAG